MLGILGQDPAQSGHRGRCVATELAEQVVHAAGSGAISITTGRLDADGAPDLAVANELDDSVSVLMNNGDATFASGLTIPVGPQLREEESAPPKRARRPVTE